jgi:hypothetical protein
MVSKRFKKAENCKAVIFKTLGKFIEKSMTMAEFTKNFAELSEISNQFYSHLIAKLEQMERYKLQ